MAGTTQPERADARKRERTVALSAAALTAAGLIAIAWLLRLLGLDFLPGTGPKSRVLVTTVSDDPLPTGPDGKVTAEVEIFVQRIEANMVAKANVDAPPAGPENDVPEDTTKWRVIARPKSRFTVTELPKGTDEVATAGGRIWTARTFRTARVRVNPGKSRIKLAGANRWRDVVGPAGSAEVFYAEVTLPLNGLAVGGGYVTYLDLDFQLTNCLDVPADVNKPVIFKPKDCVVAGSRTSVLE